MAHEDIKLEGSRRDGRPLKTCDKCGKPSEQSAGVQLSPAKWSCFKCWRSMKAKK